jgi:nitrite reductase/ring-hydroxylating ferredoxin subunit
MESHPLTRLVLGLVEDQSMEVKFLKRKFWQRILGIPVTHPPGDRACWTYSNGKLVIDLGRAPELAKPAGAIRIEGGNLPDRVLVVHGEDGAYHAFRNRCRHVGRRLDPVPGSRTVQCCSVGRSTYGYDGEVLYGPAKRPAEILAARLENGKLVIVF